MSWLRVEGKMPSHEKVAPLSDAAFRLHVTAECWCVEHESDGRVPRGIPGSLPRAPIGKSLSKAIAELVEAKLWEVGTDGDYWVHDFLKYNPSAAECEAQRQAKAQAGAIGGRRSAKARAQARSKQLLEVCSSKPQAEPKQNSSPTPTPTPTPTPDLIQPETSDPRPDRSEPAEPQAMPAAPAAAVDFTDSEQMTLCPLDLAQRARRLGVIAELASQLRVDPECLFAEAESYVAHFSLVAVGERGNRWMKRLRANLVRKAKEGRLPPPGAVEHRSNVENHSGVPNGWTPHPTQPGKWLDERGATRNKLPGSVRGKEMAS